MVLLRTFAALVSFAAVVTLATSARAEVPMPTILPGLSPAKDKGVASPAAPNTWTSRPRSLQLQGGAPGGPIGIAGLSFEYAPIKNLVLGTGAGLSLDGFRSAFMPRLRIPLTPWLAVGFGVPFSVGPYHFTAEQTEQCAFAGCSTGFRTTRTWTIAMWANAEPNIEVRLRGAIALRLYGGGSQLLNRESDRCTSTLASGCPSRLGETRAYGGFALGYAW